MGPTLKVDGGQGIPNRSGSLAKTAGYFGAFAAFGLAVAALGPTLPGLAEQTRSQVGSISLLFSARSIGYLVGALQGGRLYDRHSGHAIMVIALLGMALGLAVVPFMPAVWALAGALILLGLAEGVVEVGGNTLLLWVHRDRAGPVINGLHFSFGVGAFVAPVIVAQTVVLTGNGVAAYWFLAVLVLPVAAWLVRLPSPPRLGSPRDAAGGRRAGGLIALVAVFFVLYAGAEGSFGGWIPTYALRMGLADATQSAYLASVFWGALTAGRLLSIGIAVRARPAVVVLVGLGGCLLAVGTILAWPRSEPVLWAATAGLGVALAPIVPMTLALVQRRVAVTGKATGWFFAGLGSGVMTIPWLVGQLFEGLGPRSLPWTLAGDLVVAVAVVGWLLLYAARLTGEPAYG